MKLLIEKGANATAKDNVRTHVMHMWQSYIQWPTYVISKHNFAALILCMLNFQVLLLSSDIIYIFHCVMQLDNCCLHHKETLKRPAVASEVIPAFLKKNISVDQPNKVK